MSWTLIFQHLYLVIMATIGTIVIGLPLGVLAYLNKSFNRLILWSVDILQTLPALALLGVIMVFIGGNSLTVIIGLILYSLLPIVRNTYVGLTNIDPAIKEAATAMGMGKFYKLIHVELPLAFPVVFTGIRIAVVTSIGVAVFGTFVGGGGLGSVIYRGIHIQNMNLIMSGTLSLMAMAIIFDFSMAWIEKKLYQK
ncbi:ABC transporter permease subunit [Alkalibaculum sp. M08DMB]|uniref:ABC transporter permease subunit n=1 Tax=Alkalibaculum sporogenes TaxID=2655001 RepID=A0A6A7K5P1_9FIRM|nr:ABC transporter permease [Alkalibaculum sporogenes]MPW24587.1 ABC transporter permease subunit [Alkalibaculum sporogenes]